MTAHATGHHNTGSITAEGFHDQPWAADALCAEIGGDLWFPEKDSAGEPGQSHVREAKAICARCTVRTDCLQWALETDQRYGLWGGVSPRERAKMTPPAATGTDGPTASTDTEERPQPRSYGLAYIGGAHAHRPIPLATDIGIRPAHKPQAPRATGLDWSKHTAPDQPTTVQSRCRWCRQPADALVDDLCADCRTDAEKAFHAPDTTQLGRDLAELERTDPKVAAAAASYDDMVDRIVHPEDHVQAPASEPVEKREADVTPLDVVEHCAQLLRDTARSVDPLVRMLRGSALSVLAALDHAHHPETPAATPTPKVAAGRRPEPAPRKTTTTRRRPSSRFALAEAQRLYLDEEKTCAEIATTLGSTVSTIRKQLKAAGTPMRDDRARGSGGWNKKTADDDNPGLVDAVRRHYLDEQLTIERTAAAVGLSPKGLIGLMNRHGIERRPPANVAGQAPHWHKLDDQAVATICDRYKAGDSTVILAEAYGVSTPTITNALRRSGVHLRTPAEARRLALTRKENQPA